MQSADVVLVDSHGVNVREDLITVVAAESEGFTAADGIPPDNRNWKCLHCRTLQYNVTVFDLMTRNEVEAHVRMKYVR